MKRKGCEAVEDIDDLSSDNNGPDEEDKLPGDYGDSSDEGPDDMGTEEEEDKADEEEDKADEEEDKSDGDDEDGSGRPWDQRTQDLMAVLAVEKAVAVLVVEEAVVVLAVGEEVAAGEVAAEEVVAEEEVAAGQAMVTSQTRKLAARKRIAEKICTLLQMQKRRVDREIPKFLDLRAPKKSTKCLETWRIK